MESKLDAALECTITVAELHKALGEYIAAGGEAVAGTPVLISQPAKDYVDTPTLGTVSKSLFGAENAVAWSEQWRTPRVANEGSDENRVVVVLGEV